MSSQGDLEKRVRELEEEVHLLRGRRPGRVRYRSAAAIGDFPVVSIALGPDPEKGDAARPQGRGLLPGARPRGAVPPRAAADALITSALVNSPS